MPAIETRGLTKDYATGFWRKRPHRVLDGLDLSVERGEVFGFLGPNGAGKTTTLKLLMQLVFPTGGRAEMLGRPVGDVAVKRRIGYLPESPYFYDYLTAEELLVYFARLFGFSAADGRARAGGLLDEIGIGAERRWPLRKFSKGMLQRVGIAQALINDPELVIFDEPMSGLDPLGRRDVRALILRLRDKGCTVFFSSHVLSDAEALCSRVAILARGRLMASGPLAEMVTFQSRGWEMVVSDLSDSALARFAGRVGRSVRLGPGRYTFELPLDPPPEPLLAELSAAGAHLVSLNPIHDTLEDFFVRQVADRGKGSGPMIGARSSTVPAIAVNVFRESVRDKVLYNLVAFAILLIGASYLIGQLTAGQDMKIIKDLGLAAMLLFGLFIAVFIGIGLVSKEVERRSIYSLLSKPIRREAFILGKYCGLLLTLFVNVAAMTLAFYAVLAIMIWTQPPQAKVIWEAPALDPALLKAVLLIYAELAIVTACALFFSSFSTPMLSAAFTVGLFVIGQFNADLKHFETVVSSRPAAWLARGLYYALPNLAPFDVKAAVVHGQPVAAGYLLLTLGYGVCYIAVLLVITMTIFARRDFK